MTDETDPTERVPLPPRPVPSPDPEAGEQPRIIETEPEARAPAEVAPAPSIPFASPPPTPAGSEPGVIGVRQLVGASFDLLLRVGEPLRRASFYIGVILLGTVGPIVLALWGLVVIGYDIGALMQPAEDLGVWLAVLGTLAIAGFVVASVESQAVVVALLGSHLVGRPISVRQAVQRSRMVFWALIGASILVSIPATVVQAVIGEETEQGLILGLAAGILLQAPFVYATAGIVLGGVGVVEALKRSVRIVRARKAAGILLALLPTAFGFLLLFAIGSGLDVAIRAVEAFGLGSDSGPAGLAILTVLLVALVFALGTLLLTATGIIYAPQAVMFVSLTRATMGLDPVRPGGDHAVEPPTGPRHRFRWLTRPMLVGISLGGLALAAFLATASG